MTKRQTFAPILRLSSSVAARFYIALLLINFCGVVLIAPASLAAPARAASQVHALFDLSTPASGPFPSNAFTFANSSQNTGLRVDLPKPDCSVRPSDCEDLDVINTLDGFNLLPRVSIPFDGPIDLATVTSQTIFLISLGSTLPDGNAVGRIVGINRVVWDPLTNTLHAESDELLDQHTRYALIVTNGLRDAEGRPVEASEAFCRFRHDLNFGQQGDRHLKDYRKSLLEALKAARSAGVREASIVTASVFTTQSSTAILEKIRDQIKSATPAAADFNLGSGGTRTVFPLDGVTGITFNQQTRVTPLGFTPLSLDISLLRIIPGAVGQVAFGKYPSPDYTIHPGEYIPEVDTRSGTPQVQRMNDVFFNLFLPSGTPPAAGWPVAIFGHGSPNNKNDQPLEVAATMAAHGIATVAISFYGNGSGPLSTLTIDRTSGTAVTLPAGGRGIDQNHDNLISAIGEGRNAAPPRAIISSRDAARQTIADFMQLVRVIEVGVDVDGDGSPDLDPSRIYYFGHSLGAMWGTIFLAVEPNVRAAVFNSVGTPYDNLRLSPMFRPGSIGIPLRDRVPSLLNSPGLTNIGGVDVLPPLFNEGLPLRDQAPLINIVAGAMEIQEVLDHMKWASQSASSLACAPYLRKSPLTGVPAKSVLFQFSIGDQIATNPTTTAVLRAGDLADRATYFRNDLARGENNLVPKNPHLLIRLIKTPSVAAMARGIQEQIAVFLASDGNLIIHPEPNRFFEVPIAGPLPENLNFIP
jgi:pimeloyl-ACP methyl ester carboxylesterase